MAPWVEGRRNTSRMPNDRFDVCVVGAGVMGSATAHRLALSGRTVAVIEQFELGHKRGSSHGSSRIFRLSYPEATYVEMALEARGLWRALEQESGRELLKTTGGLDVGDQIAANAAALEACGLPFELTTGAAAQDRFPLIRVPDETAVLVQPDSGVVAADAAVAAFQHRAEAAGAEIRSLTRVEAIEPGAEAVKVFTQFGDVSASVCVVTAGSWAAGLVAPLGIEMPVWPTRETVAYFQLDGIPPTLVEWGDPSIYALPSLTGGLKVGEHVAGPPADPDQEGDVNEASLESLREWVAVHYPTAASEEHLSETCLYTNTPDERFILERHDRVVIGSPCSGHGFKFAPVIGQRLSALADEVL